ncbi:MAG: hypothetical protein KJO07_01965, partial [Deltaproteobacteria bacterium]|nr:hypothetical protein [Deltaproteobacteria bacterium]
MAKLAFRGLVFASFCLAAAACGGDDGGSGLVFVDGGDGDGGGSATCNPVSQQGCAAGEKCASVNVQDTPRIVQTLCVPDGTVAEGGECATGEPGPTTGFDNCIGGGECVFGECRPVCRQQGSTVAGTCAEGGVCQIFNDLFEDLDTDDVGICIPQCDPVDGLAYSPDNGGGPVVDYADDCGADTGLACFMNLF